MTVLLGQPAIVIGARIAGLSMAGALAEGPSLEYCCAVRNLTEHDATMHERFTIPRSALELNNTLAGRAPAARR
jgi:hypothetical protein